MIALKPNLWHDEGGWTRWNGGACPVHPQAIILPWFKAIGQAKHTYRAEQLNWGERIHEGQRLPGSILGFRVIEVPEELRG